MTEIVITVMILFSALAIRDAIVYECSRYEFLKNLNPWPFAIAILLLSLAMIWLFSCPLKKYFTGQGDGKKFYDKVVSLVISISFLLCALSLREASCSYIERCNYDENEERWLPWLWTAAIITSVLILILSAYVCK